MLFSCPIIILSSFGHLLAGPGICRLAKGHRGAYFTKLCPWHKMHNAVYRLVEDVRILDDGFFWFREVNTHLQMDVVMILCYAA